MSDQHKQKMQKIKKAVDKRIAKADQDKGLLLVLTGNGKGKSTSGFGMITRAVGHGYQAKVAQFIKGNWACGERNLLSEQQVEFAIMATGFTWETQDKELDQLAAQQVWQQVLPWLNDETVDVILLDELTYMLNFDYLDKQQVLTALSNRPSHQHVIVTGRSADEELIALADTVSEVKEIKHAFKQGIKAQQGIDW